ncbi:hypothetical protein ES705_03030 [subsurface metagenome]
MNCQKIKKLLNPYIDQALDAETAQQVEEHLKSCPACRQEYRKLKEIATSLNSFPQVSAPQNITQTIMARIYEDKIQVRTSWADHLKRWAFAPRFSFRLAGSIALTTAVIVFLAFTFIFNQPDISPECLAEVQFNLRLSEVKFQTVAIAGDFNQWNSQSNCLEDPDGDGIWTATLKLPQGRYEYMFVLDGKEWVPDPNALHYVKDGFGNINAILEINNCNST